MGILRVGCSSVYSYICGFIGASVRRCILRGLHCFNLFIVLVCWCVGVFFSSFISFAAVYGTWISTFVCWTWLLSSFSLWWQSDQLSQGVSHTNIFISSQFSANSLHLTTLFTNSLLHSFISTSRWQQWWVGSIPRLSQPGQLEGGMGRVMLYLCRVRRIVSFTLFTNFAYRVSIYF